MDKLTTKVDTLETSAEEPPNSPETPLTLAEYVQAAPEGIRSQLQEGLSTLQERADAFITGIMANKLNTYKEDELRSKSLDELQKLAAFAVKPETNEDDPETPKPEQNADFSMKAPVVVTNSDKVEPLPDPWAKE